MKNFYNLLFIVFLFHLSAKGSDNNPSTRQNITGNINWEFWVGNDFNVVNTASPSRREYRESFSGPQNIADGYISRIRGFIIPPSTGDYKFVLGSDDNSEFWLSSGESSSNKAKIIVNGQTSQAISLVAGQKYYAEVLHREAWQTDNVNLGWILPNGNNQNPIPGAHLSNLYSIPQISISSPLNLAKFNLGNTVNISTNVSSVDKTLSKVEFFDGEIKIGEDLSSPFQFDYVNLTLGTHVIKARVTDDQGIDKMSLPVLIDITDNSWPVSCTNKGRINWEFWNGTDLDVINTVPPSKREYRESFSGPTHIAEGYVSRTRGYICPPLSGEYTFFLVSDDDSQFWLSLTSNPADKKKLITRGQTVKVGLIAGQKYYAEVLHREYRDADYFNLGWTMPNGVSQNPIPGTNLSQLYSIPQISISSPSNLSSFALGTPVNILTNVSSEDKTIAKVEFFDGEMKIGEALTSPFQFEYVNPTLGTHTIKAKVIDDKGIDRMSLPIIFDITDETWPAYSKNRGLINREFWSGTDFSNLNTPPTKTETRESFSGPANIGDFYITRTSGYIFPPQSGIYTFSLNSDADSQFWLSLTSNPADKKKVIDNGQIANIGLIAGQKYYAEVIHIELSGNDFFNLGWVMPNGAYQSPIQGDHLAPFLEPYTISVQGSPLLCANEGVTLVANSTGESSSNLISLQWQVNDVAIVGATSTTYFATRPGKYNLKFNEGGKETFSSYVLINATRPFFNVPLDKEICTGGFSTLKTKNGNVRLDGINDNIHSQTQIMDVQNSFTFELWANPEAEHQIDTEASSGYPGVSGQRYLIYPINGVFWGGVDAGVGLSVGTNGITVYEHAAGYMPPILVWEGTLKGWNHIAVVYENKKARLYVNGMLVKSGLVSSRTVRPSVNLGGLAPTYGFFKGGVDEFRIWDRVRTDAEIVSSLEKSVPANTPNLILYWKLDEGRNYLANDLSSSKLNGELFNGVVWEERVLKYDWYEGTSPLALDKPSLVVSPTETSVYTIKGTDAEGCVNSVKITVAVDKTATAPVSEITTPSGNTTICSGELLQAPSGEGYSYQWQLNEIDIPGAINSNYNAVSPGEYNVVVTKGTCKQVSKFVENNGRMSPFIPLLKEQTEICTGGFATLKAKNGSVRLDGANDHINSQTQIMDVQDSFTFELWANPEAEHQIDAEASSGYPGISGQRYLIYPTIGTVWGSLDAGVGLSVGTNGISVYEHAGGYMPPILVWEGTLKGWNHIAVVYDNKKPRLYLNGMLVKSGLVSSRTVHPSVNLGGFHLPYGLFKGSVDEFRIWDRVRTDAEIASTLGKSVPVNTPNLILYWKLDEGKGSFANDLSSSKINGELINGVVWEERVLKYDWFEGSSLLALDKPSVVVSPTETSVYTLKGTDAEGCVNSAKITVAVDKTATAPVSEITTPSGNTTICGGELLQAPSGEGYSYQWQLNENDIPGATNSNYHAVSPGEYTVTVTNSACKQISKAVINNGKKASIISTPTEIEACYNETITLSAGSKYLKFDGVNDWVKGKRLLSEVSNNFTIEAWVYAVKDHQIDAEVANNNSTGLSGQKYLIFPTFGAASTSTNPGFKTGGVGVGISVGTNGVSVYEHGSNHMPSILVWSGDFKGWNHIALVFDKRVPKLYINGVWVKNGIVTAATIVHPSIELGGGSSGHAWAAGSMFEGKVDEFRVWNTVRTAEEIQSTMYTTPIPNTSGLVVHWDFEEGEGTLATDKSLTKVDGELLNGPLWEENDLSYSWKPTDKVNPSTGSTVTSTSVEGAVYHVNATNNESGCISSAKIKVAIVCNKQQVYYILSSIPTIAYASAKEKKLNIFYKEEYKSGELKYKIYNYKKEAYSGTLNNVKIGENLLSINLDGISIGSEALQVGKIYTLEVLGKKNDKYYLTFNYQE